MPGEVRGTPILPEPVEKVTKADLVRFLEQFTDDEEVTLHEFIFLQKRWWLPDLDTR
jgi:hypothetical protein